MKKCKANKIVSLLIGATMAISFWGTNVMATDIEITGDTESLGVGTYFIAGAAGLKRLSWLVNNPIDEGGGTFTSRVAANSSAPTVPSIGNISQTGGGRPVYLFNSGY